MEIRRAIDTDFEVIANLHKDSITAGFLSTLGNDFLSLLYREINNSDKSFVLIAEVEGQVVSFVAGTLNVQGLYKNVLLKNWLKFSVIIFKTIFSIVNIKRIYETIYYGIKNEEDNDRPCIGAELLAIAVDASMRGKGIGKQLITELEKIYRQNDVKIYKVVTWSKDQMANAFYTSCGFRFNRDFLHHGNLMNEYVKEI